MGKLDLLTSGVIFVVNRYECFMENKNIRKTFCGFKPSKKGIQPHQNFTGSYNKSEEAVDELQKVKLFDQHQVEFENQVCFREKEEYDNK